MNGRLPPSALPTGTTHLPRFFSRADHTLFFIPLVHPQKEAPFLFALPLVACQLRADAAVFFFLPFPGR